MKKILKFNLLFAILLIPNVLFLTSCSKRVIDEELEIDGEGCINIFRNESITKKYQAKKNDKNVKAYGYIDKTYGNDGSICTLNRDTGEITIDMKTWGGIYPEGIYRIKLISQYKNLEQSFFITINVLNLAGDEIKIENTTVNIEVPTSSSGNFPNNASDAFNPYIVCNRSQLDLMGYITNQEIIGSGDSTTTPSWFYFQQTKNLHPPNPDDNILNDVILYGDLTKTSSKPSGTCVLTLNGVPLYPYDEDVKCELIFNITYVA